MLKRFISASIAMCFIVVMMSSAFASEQTFENKISDYCASLGDADDNGAIGVSDARRALRFAVKIEIPTPEEKRRADIDGNGIVSVSDARAILRYAVNISGFEIPKTIASKNDVVLYYVTLANRVKQEYPGFSGESTSIAPSIMISDVKLSGIPFLSNMEFKEFLKLAGRESEIPEYYGAKTQEIAATAGNKNHHINLFTVTGKTWSSKAIGSDVSSATINYFKGEYRIAIKYNKSATYTASSLPNDMSEIPYGRMFNVGKKSDYINQNMGSDMDYMFNSVTFDNGSVDCNINASDFTLKTVKYFNTAILDVTMSTKGSESISMRMVTTMNTTTSYTINRLVPAK